MESFNSMHSSTVLGTISEDIRPEVPESLYRRMKIQNIYFRLALCYVEYI